MRDSKIISTVVTALLFLSLLETITFAKGPIRTVEGIITHVSDGDTLKIETAEGTVLKVRLYGIDAPELQRVNRRTGEISKQGQPFGEEAYMALESRVISKKVTVDIIDIDRYRRMVGIVRLDSRSINLEMVREGWAWAYRQYLDRPYASEYLGAENEARTKRLGLWQQLNPQPPWEFRKFQRLR